MEHTFPWLTRKYEQATREQYEKTTLSILEGYKSLVLLVDTVFNKGKNFNRIIPPSYEEALKQNNEKKENVSQFVAGQWWKSA